MQMRHHHRRRAVAGGERGSPGEQPEQAAAQRIHVRPSIKGVPGEHFGCGVGHRREHRTGCRQADVVERSGDPEIAEQHPLVGVALGGQQEVGRLDVTVHHVVPVCIVQGLRHLADDAHGPLGSHGARPQRGVGVVAVDELHRDPQLSLRSLAAAVDGHDVGMGQSRGHRGLPQEPGPEFGIGAIGRRQHLHRVQAGQIRVLRQIHRAHAAEPSTRMMR